ncbi:hypothetical protein MASR1M8_16300 [Thermomonas brevis]
MSSPDRQDADHFRGVTKMVADPCARRECKRVRIEMQAEIDALRETANRLRAENTDLRMRADAGYTLPPLAFESAREDARADDLRAAIDEAMEDGDE